MLGGLIAGALKGGADAMGDVAKMEYQGQQKMDYAKQLSDMEEQKLLRIDEAKRNRDITDIGRKATAEAAAAPIIAKGQVGGQVAGAQATLDSNLPELKANVASKEFEANRLLESKKATEAGKNEATKQTSKTSNPDYIKSITLEDYAKSAGERSVAGISAGVQREALSKPSIQQDTEGNYYASTWDPKTKKLTSDALLGPDGKQLKGPKDLDQRTSALANAMLADLKTELDPDIRKNTIAGIKTLLTTGKAPGGETSQYKDGDIVNLKSGGQGKVVTVNGKQMVEPLK